MDGGGGGGLVVIFTPLLRARTPATRHTEATIDDDQRTDANRRRPSSAAARAARPPTAAARPSSRCARPPPLATMPAEDGYRRMYEQLDRRLALQKLYAKFEILPQAARAHQSLVVTDPKVLSRFKYRLTGKSKEKLKKKYPIISGYILEHYLRYGKPPFRNFGCQRDFKWCRYGD